VLAEHGEHGFRVRVVEPRGRVADLVIASIAAANRLPLFTTDPADFQGLESVVAVVLVPIPSTGP
jgi:predicted nucleic acid-binding protein